MDGRHDQQSDLTAIRQRLAGKQGRHYWRGLAELADTAEFREFLHREFPRDATEWADPIGRRRFLQLMGASLALAGLTACGGPPREKIVPYVRQPELIVPGEPLSFATALPLDGYATGVLVTSTMGRPTKIEGNPDHPASLGATDAITQAALLTLYDPDRSQAVLNAGRFSTWEAFLGALTGRLNTLRPDGGAGLRILTGTVTSPTLASQLQALFERFPAARWHRYEPVGGDNVRAGGRLAFDEEVNPIYRFENADVILALDSDFLLQAPGSVRYARQFIDKRRVRAGRTAMNRLYVVESAPTITGAMADHRLPLRAGQIEAVARAVARELGVDTGPAPESLPPVPASWLAALVGDLQAHRGASLALAGPWQPPVVHALAHAINDALGNAGQTVVYTAPVEVAPPTGVGPDDPAGALRELVADMDAGRVDTLVILGGNPVYDAPADLDFAAALDKVPLRVHLGLYVDETAVRCQWHIPEAHPLETWSDARAFDGTTTIMQPLIAPLYRGRSAHELLSVLLEQPNRTSHTIVREYWRSQRPDENFDQFWRTSLDTGVVAGTALPPRSVTLQRDLIARGAPPRPDDAGLEIVFRPDPTIWDGRFANNGWLQELPKPLTKLTWDNAALVSPRTAERLGLVNEEVVELRFRGRAVRAPVWIVPGHADESVTVSLGYGRTRAGRVGNGAGFNAYAVRPSGAFWFGAGLELRKTGARYRLVTTQDHHSMEGRQHVQAGTIAEFQQNPAFAREGEHQQGQLPSLYPDYTYDGYAWGMSIDLNACIGCNACTLACQAENNIPVVGKDEVGRGREMHWIRVDRYYAGADLDNPETYFQPVPCMHCENAPCEQVCPVAATVHDAEGLNVMIYNRCVGTRYCSNNCPYKVRRFNFLDYNDTSTESLKLLRNPEVTVRSRGVMEKCTYCVQRISSARIAAEREGRAIRDGELQTACQQACPTNAIVFGDINDPDSQVTRLKAEPLDYSLLGGLNTRPRTTYMARLRNPNPAIGE